MLTALLTGCASYLDTGRAQISAELDQMESFIVSTETALDERLDRIAIRRLCQFTSWPRMVEMFDGDFDLINAFMGVCQRRTFPTVNVPTVP